MSSEFSHVRGCASLLIYCLEKEIQVNIPKLLLDCMLSDSLMIPNRNLPYRMMLTHVFKYYEVDLSRDTAIPPAVSIGRTLLKRMHVATYASREQPASYAPPPPQGDIGSSSSFDL